ncbi:TetR/AcrR family transcriptional regulator [Cellulomonas rhizosphaerae]|uniref:TetR/AcrR family transcriptional regulator n=1 Tax=Cellulomonas rhizosphaerae TaxID=2293719 RepID=A0A413RR34_9CELL|nr:TetR/AcrR family transcriptional regulator [Cellulomonas rhizosphaerae]RHA44449.1 TetR/AcrR family transcriptional regulator [Cellulomonas rhizosphaerae]
MPETPSASAQPPHRRRSASSRRAILDASLDLCADQGYGPVTVEAIAARAGVSKKTIYRWWPSKGAVVLEALDDAANPAADFPDSGDLLEDLVVQMEGLVRGLFSDRRFGPALVGLIADTQHDPMLARGLVDDLFGPRVEDARRRLVKARDVGQISQDADPNLVIELLYAPLYYRLLLHQGDLHDTTELRVLIEHVMRAVAPKT